MLGYITPPTKPKYYMPYRVVAASDASDESKKKAHYVCDGTNDHEEILQAINDLPSQGGIVFLTEGNFNWNTRASIRDNVALVGCGMEYTVVNLYNVSNSFDFGNNCMLKDIKFNRKISSNDFSWKAPTVVDRCYISTRAFNNIEAPFFISNSKIYVSEKLIVRGGYETHISNSLVSGTVQICRGGNLYASSSSLGTIYFYPIDSGTGYTQLSSCSVSTLKTTSTGVNARIVCSSCTIGGISYSHSYPPTLISSCYFTGNLTAYQNTYVEGSYIKGNLTVNGGVVTNCRVDGNITFNSGVLGVIY